MSNSPSPVIIINAILQNEAENLPFGLCMAVRLIASRQQKHWFDRQYELLCSKLRWWSWECRELARPSRWTQPQVSCGGPTQFVSSATFVTCSSDSTWRAAGFQGERDGRENLGTWPIVSMDDFSNLSWNDLSLQFTFSLAGCKKPISMIPSPRSGDVKSSVFRYQCSKDSTSRQIDEAIRPFWLLCWSHIIIQYYTHIYTSRACNF